jgi:hypothetical protein
MREALAEFDRQCALGDDWALELRASVLFVLGRHVDAMESLDAFLTAHPLETLPSDVRGRVTANLPLLEERVATLRPRASMPGASIRVNGGAWRPLDGALLRVEPGEARIEVSANGRVVAEATERFAAGTVSERTFDVRPPPAAAAALPPPAAQPAEPPMTGTEIAALESEAPPGLGGRRATTTRDVAPPATSATSGGGVDLVPWAVTVGVIAAVSLGVAVPLRIVSDDQWAQYQAANCAASPRPECDIVLDESITTLHASTALFVAGSVLTAGAIVLGIVQAASGGSNGEDPRAAAGLTCVPGLLGASCRMDF